MTDKETLVRIIQGLLASGHYTYPVQPDKMPRATGYIGVLVSNDEKREPAVLRDALKLMHALPPAASLT